MTLGGKFVGFTECRKPFLDFKRLSSGIFRTKSGLRLFLVGPFYSIAHTSRLILGNVIPHQVEFLYMHY